MEVQELKWLELFALFAIESDVQAAPAIQRELEVVLLKAVVARRIAQTALDPPVDRFEMANHAAVKLQLWQQVNTWDVSQEWEVAEIDGHVETGVQIGADSFLGNDQVKGAVEIESLDARHSVEQAGRAGQV